MAKTRKKKRKPTKPVAVLDRFMRPTPEREAHNDFQAAGAARRVTPVIDTMRKDKWLSESEWAALLYYRQQADTCNRSPTRDSCDFSVRGNGGDGPGARIVSAKREVDRMDRQLGSLAKIVRAIAVDDMSMKDWLIQEHGGREKHREGRAVEIVARATPDDEMFARWELKFAAKRIER